MVKVLVEDDEYYIPTKKVNNLVDLKEFYFKYTSSITVCSGSIRF